MLIKFENMPKPTSRFTSQAGISGKHSSTSHTDKPWKAKTLVTLSFRIKSLQPIAVKTLRSRNPGIATVRNRMVKIESLIYSILFKIFLLIVTEGEF